MTPTNIHIQPAPAELDQTARLPRLRSVTNDPAREYAQRPGEVDRLPDSIAALILSKKGFSKVGRNGIKVEGITPKPLNFWHEDSVTIQEKAGTKEKVLWVLNRLNPDVIHILKPSGEYVETIPLEGKVAWFDEAATRKVLGAKRRSQNRTIERLNLLHAPDSEAAADAATANDTAMKSIVHTFPAAQVTARQAQPISLNALTDRRSQKSVLHPQVQGASPETKRLGRSGANGEQVGELISSRAAVQDLGRSTPETVELPSREEGRARSSARGAFPKADRIHEIQRNLEEQRNGHAQRVQTLARRVAEVTAEDLDDLTSDDGLELVAARTATEIAAEEDASDCIL